jgi:hypothetical protein
LADVRTAGGAVRLLLLTAGLALTGLAPCGAVLRLPGVAAEPVTRGGRPVCWVSMLPRVTLGVGALLVGVEFLRRALS